MKKPSAASSINHDHLNDDGTGDVETEMSLCSQPHHITNASTLPKHMLASRSKSFNIECSIQPIPIATLIGGMES